MRTPMTDPYADAPPRNTNADDFRAAQRARRREAKAAADQHLYDTLRVTLEALSPSERTAIFDRYGARS